jgi:hypothetical protein
MPCNCNSIDFLTDASATKTECSHHNPARPSTFLVLAPISSPTYPMTRPSFPSPTTPTKEVAPVIAPEAPHWFAPELASPPIDKADTTAKEIEDMLNKEERQRRRSSTSSTSSNSSYGRPRFLKLGPVHFGGNPDDKDFTEVDF